MFGFRINSVSVFAVFATAMFFGGANAHADSPKPKTSKYNKLSDSEIYRALNFVRDVANKRHTVRPSSGQNQGRVGDTLFIDGEINSQQWFQLRDGTFKGVKRVVLNSHGGLIGRIEKDLRKGLRDGATELAQVIRDQKLTTVVPANGVCMSACTLVFQAGVRRQAHTSAIFMYHASRISKMGMQTIHRDSCRLDGDEVCEEKLQERVRKSFETTKIFFSLYEELGLSKDLFRYYNSLPDLSRDEWFEDGNVFKKSNLFFINKDKMPADEDPRLITRKAHDLYRPLEDLEKLGVVTDWFENDPGWRTDITVLPESDFEI